MGNLINREAVKMKAKDMRGGATPSTASQLQLICEDQALHGNFVANVYNELSDETKSQMQGVFEWCADLTNFE